MFSPLHRSQLVNSTFFYFVLFLFSFGLLYLIKFLFFYKKIRCLNSSLPRSAGSKSSSLPASARSGLSAMLCVDGSAMERHADFPVQSIVNVIIVKFNSVFLEFENHFFN